MQVICTDGTTLQCQRFEAIDSGVLLFGQSERRATGEEEGEEGEERAEEAMAFVPIHQLRFVLPEGMQTTAQAAQPTPQGTQAGAPPMTGQPGSQAPPQQPTGQAPRPPQATGRPGQTESQRRQ